MAGTESQSRPRRLLAELIPGVIGVAIFVLAAALFLICLGGIALLVAGVSSWLRPGDVAAAWARTLGGVGLISGSIGLAALGWLAVERLASPPGLFAHLRHGAPRSLPGEETGVRRARTFVAAIGILLALICLPFAAAIHATVHGPWLIM